MPIAGGEAGLTGCGFLHHPVQASRPVTHGAWSEQLQALGSPQSVRDPQEPLHQYHAGALLQVPQVASSRVYTDTLPRWVAAGPFSHGRGTQVGKKVASFTDAGRHTVQVGSR